MTPDAHTIHETFIDVGNGHTLYVQDWGSTDAKTPILFLHGGPGGGCNDTHKRSFDPTRQRVIFFDQRGAGKSLPYGSLEHNTTTDLVEDIEKIAQHFKLRHFILNGGSWGSCLALAYALQHPQRVSAMVLTGIFTGSQAEIRWIDDGGFRNFFPDVWQAYLDHTPKAHQHNPSQYHYEQALHGNEAAAKASAYAYACLEGALLSLDDRFAPKGFEEYDPTSSRLELHYLAHACFLPERYILEHAHLLKMPVWLVQGRYDFVCPPSTAHELHQALGDSQLILTTSGHRSERENWNVIRTILLQLTS